MNGDLFDTDLQVIASGCLDKMATRWQDGQVHYALQLGDQTVNLNEWLGRELELKATGQIFCSYCGKKTPKSYGQGYCYQHFMSLAQCDGCMMAPEKCHFDQGTCREPEWAERVCMQTHYVYLANASELKVGITRVSQIPTRWLDQGATQAIPIARVTSRFLSGLLESMFREHVSDKTNWRAMLKGDAELLDMAAERDALFATCEAKMAELVQQYGPQHIQFISQGETHEFRYPVSQYPEKIISINFDKQSSIGGTLLGIKGQYLIFDRGVINIRRHTGYEIEFCGA